MMPSTTWVALAASIPAVLAQTANTETLLGVYMFHRHGDRTSKSTPPTLLTTLGYSEVHSSGEYYRGRWIEDNATTQISGISANNVLQSQLSVTAPVDNVLQNSATGFLQGLYPPVGDSLDVETLRNGSKVQAPLNGYQLIPVEQLATGSGAESNTWLQSASGCNAATISSNNFFTSAEYMSLLASTKDFYQSLYPVVNQTFTREQLSFKNAYTIYDLIHVAEIHNATIQDSALLTNETLFQLRTLADAHEWGLAYNASDSMRAIAGKQLAGEIVTFLNETLSSPASQPKFGVQFGAYGTFASFFGLAGLPAVNPDFYGITDYASAMSFELFTNGTSGSASADNTYVRFLFHNGTTSTASPPTVYPLFGTNQQTLAWNDFTSHMNAFAISSNEQWCVACGNTTGTCAQYASANASSNSATQSQAETSSNGLSPAVNGVIGAMVTLAVVLGLEALILVAGGLRVVSKKRLGQAAMASSETPKA